MGEEQNIQPVVCEVPAETQNAVNDQSADVMAEQPGLSTPDMGVPDETLPDASIIEETEDMDPVISKLDDIKTFVRELRTSDERYMVRTDIIDALKSTFEEALEKSRVDITFSTLTDVAIAREKYKKICKAILEEKATLSVDEIIDSFVNFSIDLENILLRQNVKIFNDEGEKFDPSRNVLEKIEFSDVVGDDLIISGACSDGYSINGKMIYLQRVKVTKYQRKAE